MTNRIKTTDAGLKDYKWFAMRIKGFAALMDDISEIDSLEKAAFEAETARSKALFDKEEANKQASTILEDAKVKAKDITDESITASNTRKEEDQKLSDGVLSAANRRMKEIITEGETKVSELVSAARIEAERLAKNIKDNTIQANTLDAKVKSLTNTIKTKEASLKVIEDKLAELRGHLNK